MKVQGIVWAIGLLVLVILGLRMQAHESRQERAESGLKALYGPGTTASCPYVEAEGTSCMVRLPSGVVVPVRCDSTGCKEGVR